MRKHCMCLTFKEETSKMIFRLVVPFANRSANLRLADWLANLQDWQIGRNIYIYIYIKQKEWWF